MRLNMVALIILTGLIVIVSANAGHLHTITDVKMKGAVLSKNPGECRGLARYATSISDIGLSEKQLQVGQSCIWGDFDGNGSIDIAIWGALTESPGYVGTRIFKVLFFEEGQIIKSQIIENTNKDTLLLYPKTNKIGEFGEPTTKLDGLVQWGEGDLTYIYLYDRSSGKLQRHEFPSEHL